MEHMEMKILQPIFGILVVLTKNELTKICNEPTTNLVNLHLKLVRVKEAFHLWALNPQYHTYDKDFEYFHRYQILICKEIVRESSKNSI